MGRRKRNLEALVAALRGEVPARDCDWMEIVASANRCLVTPALAASLRGKAIPPDAGQYLALILERNTERNLRLKGQIAEAAQALNGIGVTPVMLKGAAWLLTVEHARVGERIIMDLDVMVPVDDMPGLSFASPALAMRSTASRPTFRTISRLICAGAATRP